MKWPICLLALLAASLAVPVRAQDRLTEHTLTQADTLDRVPATLDDVGWLVGSWLGTGLGGEADEVWLPPVGDAMVGMFRLSQDSSAAFYELWTLREIDGTLVLELKHFGPDMTGWEERDATVRFDLVRIEPDAAYFDGLTYRQVGADALHVWVALRGDGVVEEASLRLSRRSVQP